MNTMMPPPNHRQLLSARSNPAKLAPAEQRRKSLSDAPGQARGWQAWPVALLLGLALILVSACRSVPPTPNPMALAAKYADNFTSGTMEAKQAWDLATAQINSGDSDSARATLDQLRRQTDLSPDQTRAIEEVLGALRKPGR